MSTTASEVLAQGESRETLHASNPAWPARSRAMAGAPMGTEAATARPSWRLGAPSFAAIHRLLRRTARFVWEASELDRHVRELETAIFELDDHGPTASGFVAGLPPSLVGLQQMAYARWEAWLDGHFEERARSRRGVDVSEHPLATRIGRLIAREAELLDGRLQRALVIGSGPVPTSAVVLHELTGATVDCIDDDPCAAARAAQLLDRLGRCARVRALHADVSSIDPRPYDAIVFGLLAAPPAAVLERLRRSVHKSCRIVCRTSSGLRQLLCAPLVADRDLTGRTIVRQHVAVEPGDVVSSLLVS